MVPTYAGSSYKFRKKHPETWLRVTAQTEPDILLCPPIRKRLSTMKQIKAIKFGLTFSTLALLAACAAPGQTSLSDGTTAIRIECLGTARGLNACLERAGKSCGAAGYKVVDQDGQTVFASGADAGMDALVRTYEEDQSSILVKCGS